MARPRLVPLLLVATIVSLWPLVAPAQDTTPEAAPARTLDLAAMALAPEDVPNGFFDDYSEWWVPAAAFGELVLGSAPPPGLGRVYQTFYVDPENGTVIHTYLFEFGSPEDAASGLEVVAPSLRPPLPEGTTVGPTESPGPELGEEPRTITAVTYDTWEAGGPRADVVAATFRSGSLLAGVAVERYTDRPPSGTPAPEPASPRSPDPAQEQLAVSLATRLDERIAAVIAGEVPPGVDFALADAVLPLDQLVSETTPMFGGYKSGVDLLRCGICGEENALLPYSDVVRGGVSRSVVAGPLVGGEPQPPFVSIAVSEFASPEAALQVLDAIRDAPNDRPTTGPFPRGERTPVADPTIPGATAALAFQAVFDAEDPNAPADSAGVGFVVGNLLATVDVLGGLTADEASAAALDLASQQAACLESGGPCRSATLPPSLAAADHSTPPATPND
jgi:hypothetical protein